GLEQEFNSLHAQREACEAFILSQKHEGWELVCTPYDDGGFSGGNMNRPGLAALIADVEAGLIDVIVVYKVDRLTRSLADFAKIVERLDAREASFVSVTQAFNTTTSMGRLTLNVLLSFAQFEREVTGERIRDKIAASKKKGMWMGGPVPLGYEVIERKLIPVPQEAEQVRQIMRRYIASSSANELIAELEAEGNRTKIQRRTSGPHRGGIPFRRGSLFHLLKNPIYRGMIIHRGTAYPGEHEAIVDEELWEAVQARLAAKAPPRKRAGNDEQDALLKGMLTDPHGRPMVPTFTCKGTRRYRYYETRRDLAGEGQPPGTRFGMHALDRHMVEHLEKLLEDEHALRRLSGLEEGCTLRLVFEHASKWLKNLGLLSKQRVLLATLVTSTHIGKNHIEVAICPKAFSLCDVGPPWRYSIDLPVRRPFREAKLRIESPNQDTPPADPALIKLLQDAAVARTLVLASPGMTLNAIAKREQRCRKQLAKLLRIGWLSPRIVEAIVDGTSPAHLD
ncbi:MAG: recombinase family protein, partial [Alcanivorax sp.]|nr:recombinase family protein [Alcanivorax sp.]